MNEDFVPYELAVKLEEKGFNEPCNAYYEPIKLNLNFCKLGWRNSTEKQLGVITAPTISQVLKWLREEKKMHIIVEISDSGWYYTIYPSIRWENGKLKSDTYIMSFKNKESYEQAALAGIEYVLDNLI